MRTLTPIAALVLFAGCSDATTAPNATGTLRITANSAIPAGALLEVRAHNPTEHPLLWSQCEMVLERQEGSKWKAQAASFVGDGNPCQLRLSGTGPGDISAVSRQLLTSVSPGRYRLRIGPVSSETGPQPATWSIRVLPQ